MTHVLIAVDDTDSSVVAARTAHRLFGDEARYTVISVADDRPVYWGDDPIGSGVAYPLAVPPAGVIGGMPLVVQRADTAGNVREPIDLAEQTAQETAVQAGIHEAKTIGDTGDPAQAIIAAARDYGADVIVVGGHEHGWFGRLFTSSVSDKVVRQAETPVLVAR